ncbi:MAG: hypothetical protein GF355_03305, partial [Candidatus Eisenbacteria bacterium]|nr:hypothetical protein [Candidatus Eisenbacteria bacterium]
TSLDLELQQLAEAAFDSVVPERREGGGDPERPPAGAVVVLDCRSGDVLALVSRPAFHPGEFIRGLSTAAWGRIRSGRHPLLNRPVQSKYPPGSVFKIVTAMLAFEEGVATRSTRFSPCYGSYRLGTRSFGCWKEEGHGVLGLIQAVAQSCDVYFYQVGRALGFERLTQGARALAIDRSTGIDLENESAGWIPQAEDYVRLYGDPPGPGVPLNLSIGQGELLFTPLELAVLYAAVANGGELLVPRLGLRALAPDGSVVWARDEEPEVRARWPVADATLDMAREALEEVIEGPRGTARAIRIDGYRLGGKTGTAQNPHGEDHALFAAVAPMDAPRWVVVVVAEESGHGGAVAAPVAHSILERLLAREGRPDLAQGESQPAGAGNAAAATASQGGP